VTGDPTQHLRSLLEAGGETWPAPLEHHVTVASTNDRLKDWASEGAPDLAAVTAESQTGGRGRHGRRWASPRGNLYLSVLLRPPAAVAALVPLLGGVAVARALGSFGVEARLKWPNDVLVGEGKLAGVLAEASSGPAGPEWVVLGVGVNLDPQAPPPEAATSVRQLTGRVVAPATAAAAVLVETRLWYHRLAAGRAAELLAAWRERSVPWWGCRVEVSAGDRVVRGVAQDIDDDGALLLAQDGGRVERVVSGEVARFRLAQP
jgi:BirA family biotin operon repressor/biotin-[acetyl-CoA-carboxylase] ligase